MTGVSDLNVSAAIEEGSWFVLYVVSSPAGFRCDLETKVDPILTAILDRADFAHLRRSGFNAGKPLTRGCALHLTPFCYLTISACQTEEFYAAHDRISAAFNLQLNKEEQQDV